jgi:hypothetical protein
VKVCRACRDGDSDAVTSFHLNAHAPLYPITFKIEFNNNGPSTPELRNWSPFKISG